MPDTRAVLFGVGWVLALAALAYIAARKGGLTEPGALNPASPNNLAYRGVNALGVSLTGNPDWNLGGAIYEGGVFQSPNVFAFVGDSLIALLPDAKKAEPGPFRSMPEFYTPEQSPFGFGA